MRALPGDSLVAPFWCDWCWFENLDGMSPDAESYSDSHLFGQFVEQGESNSC